jgi:hypothetical protein
MMRRYVPVLILLMSSALLACGPDRVEIAVDTQVNTLIASPGQPTTATTTYEAVPEPVEEEASTLVDDVPSPDGRLAAYPAWNGYDLDCPDVGHPVSVPDADPHRLDADNDGVGCEGQH